MNSDLISPEKKELVQTSLQEIYDLATLQNNFTSRQIVDEVVKINELMNIDILM